MKKRQLTFGILLSLVYCLFTVNNVSASVYKRVKIVPDDYTLSTDSSTVTVCQGNDAIFNLVVGQIGAFTTAVNFSTSGLPVNALPSFSNPSVVPPGTSSLLISTIGVTPGTYTFTIQGDAAGNIKQVTATLTVLPLTVNPSSLISPSNSAINQAIATTFNWSNSGLGLIYTIEIATDNSFLSIIESATGLTATTYTASLLAPLTEYFWRVKTTNSCSSEVNSSDFSFITEASCITEHSIDVPLLISGTGTPTVTSILTINQYGTVDDLNIIDLQIDHSYTSDLKVTITSPQGTSVELFTGICGGNDNIDLAFDDQAASSSIPCPATDGLSYIPNNPLSTFNGEQIYGDWVLTILDLADQDGGAINSWGINACFTPTTPCVPTTEHAIDVPILISGSGTPTVTSILTITQFGTVEDLNIIDLQIDHSYTSDLKVTITSPQGTSIQLFSGICGGDDNINLAFDDQAASSTIPCPATDGLSYIPNNPLSSFYGEQIYGDWVLTVSDLADQDGGAINSWGINTCFTPTAPCYPSTISSIAGSTEICQGDTSTLEIVGSLNDATEWKWYSGSCNGTYIGSGPTIDITSPGVYFVRGEGGCLVGGNCTPIVVTRPIISSGRTLSGSTITATQSGASYQWVMCPSMTPVIGETNQTFTPTVVGQYAAYVSLSGCTVVTPCISVDLVELKEITLTAAVYPNPTDGLINIQLPNTTNLESLEVKDITGRIINSFDTFSSETIKIDLGKEAKGMYYIHLKGNGKEEIVHIIKF